VGQDLVHAPAGHHIAREKERDRRLVHQHERDLAMKRREIKFVGARCSWRQTGSKRFLRGMKRRWSRKASQTSPNASAEARHDEGGNEVAFTERRAISRSWCERMPARPLPA
jgi:hypothetical protein